MASGLTFNFLIHCLTSLCVLGSFVVNELSIYVWIYFWALSSVPLICVYVFAPEPCCFDYYSSIGMLIEMALNL